VASDQSSGGQSIALWHDGTMSKRSTRIAKRNEFENSLKEVEEKLRSRRGNTPVAITPESTGRSEGQDGESQEVEMHKPEEK
jgi:hypothetical protein